MCNTILQEGGVWEKWREKSKEEVKDKVYNSNEAKELKECEWYRAGVNIKKTYTDSKTLFQCFLHLSIRSIFHPCLRLAHFFPFKDRIGKSLGSRVAYQFKC